MLLISKSMKCVILTSFDLSLMRDSYGRRSHFDKHWKIGIAYFPMPLNVLTGMQKYKRKKIHSKSACRPTFGKIIIWKTPEIP
mmetsp:Transcript_84819/g.226336  ORF Transcript_84819/g.226336 Transcript_84819/m.226336 type:complete len:83 (-) Transcript_84819:528-776(-)